jgi:hypothetical protein
MRGVRIRRRRLHGFKRNVYRESIVDMVCVDDNVNFTDRNHNAVYQRFPDIRV